MLIVADAVRFVALVTAAILAIAGYLTIPLLYGIVCFISLFHLVFDAALGALIPQLLDSDRRLTANSRLSISVASGDVVGPGLADADTVLMAFEFQSSQCLLLQCIVDGRFGAGSIKDEVVAKSRSIQ